MRRPPHGATASPGPRGPGNGYGRWAGRPGPRVPIVAALPVEPTRFGVADVATHSPAPSPLDAAPTP
jgi:hypothetical protein